MRLLDASEILSCAGLTALLAVGIDSSCVKAQTPVRLSRPSASVHSAKEASRPLAPHFTLTDTAGVKRSLSDYRGRPVAVFFYCGCEWCHKTATMWGQFQRGNALPSDAAGRLLPTVIVFSGDASSAVQFRDETGLDPNTSVLLPDPQMDVTLGMYDAEPCPRVFVIDPSGHIAYTNNHTDDAPRKAPAIAIVSQALDALRTCLKAEPK